MAEMVYVVPAAGGRVRQPERQSRVMPPEGAWVPRDAHYERLIAAGDVTPADPPDAKAAAKIENKPEARTEAKPEAETAQDAGKSKSNSSSGRGPRAATASED